MEAHICRKKLGRGYLAAACTFTGLSESLVASTSAGEETQMPLAPATALCHGQGSAIPENTKPGSGEITSLCPWEAPN